MTVAHCVEIKARESYKTAQCGLQHLCLCAASLQTEGVTHSRDGEAILSF